MALSIKDPEADRLARELAARTGETLTEAIVVALRERLARETGRTAAIPLGEELAAIRRRCAGLPVLDDRCADHIIGYGEQGLPV
ncbi:MAG: type II toxin-antitoxin system VapB family antitoxin [Mycobacterium sp.]|jgi:antitoxin VapB